MSLPGPIVTGLLLTLLCCLFPSMLPTCSQRLGTPARTDSSLISDFYQQVSANASICRNGLVKARNGSVHKPSSDFYHLTLVHARIYQPLSFYSNISTAAISAARCTTARRKASSSIHQPCSPFLAALRIQCRCTACNRDGASSPNTAYCYHLAEYTGC